MDVELDSLAEAPEDSALYCPYHAEDMLWEVSREDGIGQPDAALRNTYDLLKGECVDHPENCSDDYEYSIEERDLGSGGSVYREIWDTSTAPVPNGFLAAGKAVIANGSSACTTTVVAPGISSSSAAVDHLDRSLGLSALACGLEVDGLDDAQETASELPTSLPGAPPEAAELLDGTWELTVEDPNFGGTSQLQFSADSNGAEHLEDGSGPYDFTWTLEDGELTICTNGNVAVGTCSITYTGTKAADGTYAGRGSTGPKSDFAWTLQKAS